MVPTRRIEAIILIFAVSINVSAEEITNSTINRIELSEVVNIAVATGANCSQQNNCRLEWQVISLDRPTDIISGTSTTISNSQCSTENTYVFSFRPISGGLYFFNVRTCDDNVCNEWINTKDTNVGKNSSCEETRLYNYAYTPRPGGLSF